MSERAPETQSEAIVGLNFGCRDIESVIGRIQEDSFFDAFARVKDASINTGNPYDDLQWPTAYPQDRQQMIIGAGSVVDIVKANRQKEDFARKREVGEVIRVSSHETIQRFLLDRHSYVFTLLQKDSTPVEPLTVADALELSKNAFIERILADNRPADHDGSSPNSYEARVAEAAKEDVMIAQADTIYTDLKRLEPSIDDTRSRIREILSAGDRVFAESSHDVSADIAVGSKKQLNEHLSALGVDSVDRLHGVFNFVTSDGKPLNAPELSDILRIYKPDHLVGTGLYLIPVLGEAAIATFIAGYRYSARDLKATSPAYLGKNGSPLYAKIEAWDEDVRYVTGRKGLSPNAESFVANVEETVERNDIELADLGTSKIEIETKDVPVDKLQQKLSERDKKFFDYTEVPSIFDDPEFIPIENIDEPSNSEAVDLTQLSGKELAERHQVSSEDERRLINREFGRRLSQAVSTDTNESEETTLSGDLGQLDIDDNPNDGSGQNPIIGS